MGMEMAVEVGVGYLGEILGILGERLILLRKNRLINILIRYKHDLFFYDFFGIFDGFIKYIYEIIRKIS